MAEETTDESKSTDEKDHLVVNLNISQEPERHCWVCFATDEDDERSDWLQPCFCKGTSKWVHQGCLQRWVDEKQRGNPAAKVMCPQCNTAYIIVYPNMGPVVLILDSIDLAMHRVCPFLAAGLMVGSIYWVAVTYGAVTVMQVMGQEEAQEFLEMSDPLFLLLTLPAIPVTLLLGKMIQWENMVLGFLRRNVGKISILKYILPSLALCTPDLSPSEAQSPVADPVCVTRTLCSALVLPTMATVVGNVFFRSVTPHVQRTALGAIAFLVCKGVFKLYHKHQMFVRQCQRRVLDYDPELAPNSDLPSNNA